MADVRRVRAIWTGVAGSPYISTWWFEAQVGAVGTIQAAIRTFLEACKTQLTSALQVSIEPDQGIFNAENGDLIGVETQSSGAAIVMTGTGQALPPADQFVLKLSTPGIVNNRRVRGRFYLPGGLVIASVGGVPATATANIFNTAAASLITATTSAGPWVVYSKPLEEEDIPQGSKVEPRVGTIHNVQSASTWNKFGVQRRRRD